MYETDRDPADAITSLAVGTSGTIPNWTNVDAAYTLNIPNASVSAGSRGLITDATQTLAGRKVFQDRIQTTGVFGNSGSFLYVGYVTDGAFLQGTNVADSAVNVAIEIYNEAAGIADLPHGGLRLSSSFGGNFVDASFSVRSAGTLGSFKTGAWGTDSIGNVISGGLVTTISSTAISIGSTIGGSPASGGLLFPNGSGALSQDAGLTFDAALDALTLGGYLISKQTSAPSGIPTGSVAGPWAAV